MTIPATSRIAGPFFATGSSQAIAFGFRAFGAQPVRVESVNPADGTVSVLAAGIDYALSLNPDQQGSPGGHVTLTRPVGHEITIVGTTEIVQGTQFASQGGQYPAAVERGLDRLTAILQELKDVLERVASVDPAELAAIRDEVRAAAEQALLAAEQTSGIHEQLAEIYSRLSQLEYGIVPTPPPVPEPPPAPEPPPPPPPPASHVFDFSGGVLPEGAAFLRSSGATCRASTGLIASAGNDVARFDHTEAGSLRGLILEKPVTNLLPYGRTPGDNANGWDHWSGAVVTLNAAVAPDGTTTASRLQLPAGDTNGINYGLEVSAIPHRLAVWARSRSGSPAQVAIRNLATGFYAFHEVTSTWTRISSQGTPAAGWLNANLVNMEASAIDIEVWGMGLYTGDLDQPDPTDVLNNTGGSVTRALDRLLLDVPSGTYEVHVEYDSGAPQVFYDQVVAGDTLEVDAAAFNLNRNRIRKIEARAPGEAPDPEDPVPPGDLLTSASVIDQMAGKNDFRGAVMRGPDGYFGFSWNADPATSAIPGCTTMGQDARGSVLPQWAKTWMSDGHNNQYLNSTEWPRLIPWMLAFISKQHTVSGVRLQTRRHQVWGLRKTSEQWERLMYTDAPIWDQANYNLIFTGTPSEGLRDESANGGGRSLLIRPWPQSLTDHGIMYQQEIRSTDYYYLIHAYQGRLIPDTPADAWKIAASHVGLHSGADWVHSATQPTKRPGQCVSRIVRVPQDGSWKWFAGCPFLDAGRIETMSPFTVGYPASAFAANPPPFHLF